MRGTQNGQSLANFVWSVADLLRGDYKQHEYGQVILPFMLLRRLDYVLEPTKAAVLRELERRKGSGVPVHDFVLRKARKSFYNASPLDFAKLLDDPNNIRKNTVAYRVQRERARCVRALQLPDEIARLDGAGLLYKVVQKFTTVDLHPDTVSNADMGSVFEELIRRFAELSNATAGEHYTPRQSRRSGRLLHRGRLVGVGSATARLPIIQRRAKKKTGTTLSSSRWIRAVPSAASSTRLISTTGPWLQRSPRARPSSTEPSASGSIASWNRRRRGTPSPTSCRDTSPKSAAASWNSWARPKRR